MPLTHSLWAPSRAPLRPRSREAADETFAAGQNHHEYHDYDGITISKATMIINST